MQAVILAGGKGTRLAERLNGRPKPLVDVAGVPLLERQIIALAGHGVDDVVVLVNHAANQIEDFFAERKFRARVRLVDDGEPRGTAGALLACLDMLDERFLIVYGDTLFDIDVSHMLAAHVASGAAVSLLLHPNDHPADSDLVELSEDGRVTAFHGYPHPDEVELRNLVNAAFYVIDKKALLPFLDHPVPCDFAKNLFPAMLAAGVRFHGYVSYEYIKDLGTPRRLDKVERHLLSGVVDRASRRHPQRAVFVDRDGTLNVLRGYIQRPADLTLLPGAADAVHRLNGAEYRVILVTNQPVIARGECTFEGLRDIHNRLESELGREGAYLDAIYYCPHHPDAGFAGEVPELKIICECRKPMAGMLLSAIHEMNVDLGASWMIGDSTADVVAAHRAGLRSVLVGTGEGGRDGKYFAVADFNVQNVAAAAHLIIDQYPRVVERIADFISEVRTGDVVLIGGLARSGKSTIAGTMRGELAAKGLSAKVIALDGWILPVNQRGVGFRGRFDLQAVQRALLGALRGDSGAMAVPIYDRQQREQSTMGSVEIADGDVLIVEGVPALLLDLPIHRRVRRIYVDADEAPRRSRVIEDLRSRGANDELEAERIYAQRQADEASEIARSRQLADAVFNLDFPSGAAVHDH